MKRKINKKGLVTGLFVLIVFLFLFAFTSMIAYVAWQEVNTTIQNTPNSTINQPTKDKITTLTVWFTWADPLFVWLFIVLILSYLVSATTTPTQSPFFFIVFCILLVVTTIIAMIFSNAWQFVFEHPSFVTAAGEFYFTNFFMTYFPFINFFVGIGGALLFYGRTRVESKNLGGGVDVDFTK